MLFLCVFACVCVVFMVFGCNLAGGCVCSDMICRDCDYGCSFDCCGGCALCFFFMVLLLFVSAGMTSSLLWS